MAIMANGAVLCFFSVLGIFSEGLAVLIETEQTVMAAVGGEVRLSCQLVQSKDVRQVTWQKVLPEGEKDLASSNKYFGHRVKSDFTDKVEFKDAGLQNNSIMIRKVTKQDEGCYRCLFNIYPDGALTARTCLQLYELHEPVLHVGESNSTGELVVSCSVSGQPAPTVTLTVTQPDLNFSNYSSVSVNNADATVTVTTTAVLTGSPKNGTQVGCAGRVLSGCQREVFVTIPEVKQTSEDGEKLSKPQIYRRGLLCDPDDWINTTVLAAVAVCVCVGLIFAVLFIPKHKNSIDCLSRRDPERNKTPQKPTQDHEVKTPLMKQENETRRRTPTQTGPTNNGLKAPSSGRRLFEEEEGHCAKTNNQT